MTYHADASRSGVQANEKILTPSLLLSSHFGKLGSLPVAGSVYAQPLVVSNIKTADGTLRTLVVIATSADRVYAFDAGTLQTVWSVSLLAQGESTVVAADVGSVDMAEIGITGTPVVDATSGILYLVAKSKLVVAGQQNQYHMRLHALRLSDGSEAFSSGVEIQASVPGSAMDAVDGAVVFDPLRLNQRSALLLSHGTVWISFGSHGDVPPYHGWLLGYSASGLATNFVFNTTPNGAAGGIWNSGNGPAADASGNLYLAIGNGSSDGMSSFGSTAARFSTGPSGQSGIADFYTPSNQAYLTQLDYDFGTMGDLLLPDQTGSYPHLLVSGVKDGTLDLINRDHMGGFENDTSLVQSFNIGSHLHANGVFFNNSLYIGGDNAPVQAFSLNPGTALFTTAASSQTSHIFAPPSGTYIGGTTPGISADGTKNGILWAIDNGASAGQPAVLYAYDASNLSTQLYSSAASAADAAAPPVKFTTPTIAYGRVFAGGFGAVTVYGAM